MDSTQARIIELLREVHLLAIKEVERLNLRIVELESQQRQPTEKPTASEHLPAVIPAAIAPPPIPRLPDILNEHQVADYLNSSVASVRRWRLFRKGPNYLKIGAAVHYRRRDLEVWLDSCPGLAGEQSDRRRG